MQKFQAVLILVLIPFLAFSQQTIETSLMHDGLQREYILYVPENYTGDEAVPLVLNFHGYTSNANQQMAYGDFREIADSVGFIIAHPQGTLLDGITHFNVGGWTLESTTDDVGFSSTLIDELAVDYNIDLTRVYATGMSNGGFMSFLLACQLSDKIAAIASVTGSMTPQIYDNCDPQHQMPVLQIHGNIDAVVPYLGNAAWTRSIDDVIAYWGDFNNCEEEAAVTEVENTNLLDLSTVEHSVYNEGDNGATVEHFKVTGGGHTWPGAAIGIPGTGTNQDINASQEIWRFFSQYDINGLVGTTSTGGVESSGIKLYPNPTSSSINIDVNSSQAQEYAVFSPFGKHLMSGQIVSDHPQVDLSALPPNVYLVKINNEMFRVAKIR